MDDWKPVANVLSEADRRYEKLSRRADRLSGALEAADAKADRLLGAIGLIAVQAARPGDPEERLAEILSICAVASRTP